MIDPIALPRALAVALLDHAHQAAPAEAVGLLGGIGNRVTRIRPLRNLIALGGFFADPHDQFLAEREFSRLGLTRIAVYHSHPHGCVEPSETDWKYGALVDTAQVLISFGEPHGTEIRAYTMRGPRPKTRPLVFV